MLINLNALPEREEIASGSLRNQSAHEDLSLCNVGSREVQRKILQRKIFSKDPVRPFLPPIANYNYDVNQILCSLVSTYTHLCTRVAP